MRVLAAYAVGGRPAQRTVTGEGSGWRPRSPPHPTFRPRLLGDGPGVLIPRVVERRVIDRTLFAVGADLRGVASMQEVGPQEVVRTVVVQLHLELAEDVLALLRIEFRLGLGQERVDVLVA